MTGSSSGKRQIGDGEMNKQERKIEQNKSYTEVKRATETQSKKLLGIDSEHKLRSENLPFDIDVWYPRLKRHTYKSFFLPLTRREAQAILNHYQTAYLARHRLRRSDVQVLEALERTLDKLFWKRFRGKSAFLRLCGRSPKDGDPLDKTKVWAMYTKQLKEISGKNAFTQKGAYREIDVNLKLRAIGRVNYLSVSNGAEALALLLSSERVYTDLHDWLRHGEPEQIVLREWDEDMRVDREFRVYVHQSKICAISQYDHYTYYPELAQHKATIEKLIREEWAKIHLEVGIHSYCMDFVYIPAAEKSARVRMIEISPFLPCTGPACFSWTKDRDVLEGRSPFEFRLVEEKKYGKEDEQKQQQHQSLLTQIVEANWDRRWCAQSADNDDNNNGHFSIGTETRYYKEIWGELGLIRGGGKDAKSMAKWSGIARRVAFSCGLGVASFLAFRTAASSSLASSFTSSPFSTSVIGHRRACTAISVGVMISFLLSIIHFSKDYNNSRQSSRRPLEREEEEEEEPPAAAGRGIALFVYGTLKRGFHWHGKFLQRNADYIGKGKSVEKFPLVFGSSGVPYCLYDLKGSGYQVEGELYWVDEETLEGLDEYEGVIKKHYIRRKIKIEAEGDGISVGAFVYFKSSSNEELKALEFHPRYSLSYHKKNYDAIRHIQVKQQLYLEDEHGEGRFGVDLKLG